MKLFELENPTDTIEMDVPLFIRLLEYAREDAESDMDLHLLAENAMKLGGVLTMAQYSKIIQKR